MDQLALLFVLLLGAVVSVPVGDRLGLPAPVLMTLLGIVLACWTSCRTSTSRPT